MSDSNRTIINSPSNSLPMALLRSTGFVCWVPASLLKWTLLPLFLISMLTSSILKVDHSQQLSTLLNSVVMQSKDTDCATDTNPFSESRIELDVVSRCEDRIQVRTLDGRMLWLPDSSVQIVFESKPKVGIRIG